MDARQPSENSNGGLGSAAQIIPFIIQMAIFAFLIPYAALVLPVTYFLMRGFMLERIRRHLLGATVALEIFSVGYLLWISY